jgi:glycosyltransferase involved in cell wall biosynthesis
MKVALVHDFLIKMGGAERVLSVLADMFPDAPIYTLLYDYEVCGQQFTDARVMRSYLQNSPRFLKKRQRYLLPFMPRAIESFDFSPYDLVISSSNAFAHGVLIGSHAKHICYCHSPMRYAWDYAHEYIKEQKVDPLRRYAIEKLMKGIRVWDQVASDRPDRYIANSYHVRTRIKKYYHQDADVLYPPVDTRRFHVSEKHDDYFLIVSALTPFKKLDLAVQLFNKIQKRLVIIGEGAQKGYLKSIAGPTVEILGKKTDKEVQEYMQNCRAYILPAEEDFGIAPIEAMACGKPVLAYGKGGARETVIPGATGELFYEPTIKSIEDGLGRLIVNENNYGPRKLRAHANLYAKKHFIEGMEKIVSEVMR